MKMYKHLACQIARLRNLQDRVDNYPDEGDGDEYARLQDMRDEVHEALEKLVRDKFPSGSGFDSGTKLDIDNAHPNRYTFRVDFHHMNDGGYYDGWTEHMVIVTPDMQFDFDARVTGRNRNQIKDYIGETFHQLLNSEVQP